MGKNVLFFHKPQKANGVYNRSLHNIPIPIPRVCFDAWSLFYHSFCKPNLYVIMSKAMSSASFLLLPIIPSHLQTYRKLASPQINLPRFIASISFALFLSKRWMACIPPTWCYIFNIKIRNNLSIQFSDPGLCILKNSLVCLKNKMF